MKSKATCHETQEYLQEFMDAALTRDLEGRLRAHLETCPTCAAELGLQREIRNHVAAGVPRREPPAELQRKVQEILTPKQTKTWGLLPRPALQWGMAVAALVLIVLVPLTLLNRDREERIPPILIEAINDHRSFAMRVDPAALPTADRQEARKWLKAKVGLEIDPPMGQAGGLRFMGGDVSFFLERKVACLLYGKGEKLVSLFVLPDEGVEVPRKGFRHVDGVELYVAFQNGYGVVLWKKGNLLYSVVSELPQEELLGVAKEMAKI